jgi:hypothetical protein
MSAVTTDNECVVYARECVRLAGLAESPELRKKLLQMARDWMAAAMRDEKTAPKLSPRPSPS